MPLQSSWVASANDPIGSFPLNNLPYGVFSHESDEQRCGVAIGAMVLDVTRLESEQNLRITEGRVFTNGCWSDFMALGPRIWVEFRQRLVKALGLDAPSQIRSVFEAALIPLKEVCLHMPFEVAEYTDFYAGKNHAFNVGSMFRGPENALPPNWLHIPLGYNGRASSVVVSGTSVRRPWGQIKPFGAQAPEFAPSRKFDLELELGAIVGTPSCFGQPVSVAQADEMIFGYVLLNDWSARDIQAWEYQPLGPFQAKASATSISPWIVTSEALRPFRVSSPEREKPLLPYLQEQGPLLYDIELEILLQPEAAVDPSLISRTNARELYYSAPQQLSHHSSSGCPMRTGDLLGSGTISGPTRTSCGSLLELSWGGKEPLTLETGETRSFLVDGDTLILRGQCLGDGYLVGFGECLGQILPAHETFGNIV